MQLPVAAPVGGPEPAGASASSGSAGPSGAAGVPAAAVPFDAEAEDLFGDEEMPDRGVVRARDEEASRDEPPELRARVAGLPVSVDRSDFAYHGLDGEDSERLQRYAVSTGESLPNKARASELVTESVVYDCRTGEELPLDLVAAGRAQGVAQMN